MTMAHRMTRRGFLRAAAAAPLVPLVVGLGGCGAKEKQPEKGRVIVVGGGLCGLVALDRLVKAGRDAILLEAGTRLGGRIYTVRERRFSPGLSLTPLPAGLRAEAGAERIGVEDVRVRGLLQELGIQTAAYPASAKPFDLLWKDKSYSFKERRDLPKELFAGFSDVELSGAPIGILQALVQSAKPPAGDDSRSGIEWLRSIGMSPNGEEFVRAFTAMPLEGMPAPVLYRHAMRELKASRSDTIAGGTDRLVDALAARHAGAITKGVAITAMRQDEKGVVLSASEGRKFEGVTAIICLPLKPLRALKFEGGTPRPLADRLGSLEVGHEIKWASEGHGRAGYEFSERCVSWSLPEKVGGTFIVQTLSWEPNAGPWPDNLISMGSFGAHNFSTDPLIGGAYAYSTSGRMPEGIVRAGRLIFAGADLSDAPGWMEGAVRAAEQAVATLVR